MEEKCAICKAKEGKRYLSEALHSDWGYGDAFSSLTQYDLKYVFQRELICCDECLAKLLKNKEHSPETVQKAVDTYLESESKRWKHNRCEVCGEDADFRVFHPVSQAEGFNAKALRIALRCRKHQNVPVPLFLQGIKDIGDDEIVCASCEIRVPKDTDRCPSCNKKIVTCRKCQTRVSRAAEKCPKCGYKLGSLPLGCVIVALAVFIAFLIFMWKSF